jgi:hypothetical protein
MRSQVPTGVRQPIQGSDHARLITQRSQVQILSPLLQKPLSESLSVLRRKGPDHCWQQFGSKHRRRETRPRPVHRQFTPD